MGWPEKTEDLERYYPTSVLVTGYDIIFFWVARMIFSGMEHMGEKPFSTVFIHGLVRDAQGRKMSKSLGNGIDPLKVIEEFGADALRFALATGNAPGNDMRFSDEKIESARNFANKLWNASRFVLMNLTESDEELLKTPDQCDLTIEDKWILSKFNTLAKNVNDNINNYELGVALAEIYSFTWDTFCDWYIEMAKSRIFESGAASLTAKRVLVKVLSGIVGLLHPYMPFITEEIYQALPHDAESIMIAEYPKARECRAFPADAEKMTKIIDAIKAIRARRSEMNVPPSKKAKVYLATKYQDVFASAEAFFVRLASASELVVADVFAETEVSADNAVQIITDSATVFLPLADIIDFEKEKARLEGEKKKLEGEIERIEKKLANAGFVAKAPANVVEAEKAKLEKYKETLAAIEAALAKLN
jgi:valyl-tRNA synthetase